MAGMNTTNSQLLIRADLWSNQIKDILKDELDAQRHVDWISFPDGNTLHIPSFGDMDISDYTEDSAIEYTALSTGEFIFQITEYKSAGTYITAKDRQDSFYASRLESAFVPKMKRALDEDVEMKVLDQGQPGTPNGQTANSSNLYNGAAHRFVGTDTANSNPTIGFKDFAKVLYSLKKANVPQRELVAIVDPSTEYHFNTLADTLNVQYNPMWTGIVSDSVATGMRFSRNIMGFDIYVSNYLSVIAAGETIDGRASGANAVANIFFSASGDVKPFIGAWRQAPKVDAEWNKDRQREEYVMTARYGVKLYRPENFVTVLTSTNVIV